MQHPCGIANAARIHRHIHNLLLDGRRLTGVGILQEKRAPAPLKALPAAIPLLALRRRAMPDDIGPMAIGTVQHLGNHRSSHFDWYVSSAVRG